MTRLKANRKVRIDHGEARAVSDQPIAASGTVVWLPGYGAVRVFRGVAPDGDTVHWATNDLGMDEAVRQMFAEWSWSIEQSYRELKDELGLDHFEGRSWRGWNHHVVLVLMAYAFLQDVRRRRPKKGAAT